MSVSYYSYAVIGCEVEIEKATVTKRYNHIPSHKVLPEDFFCRECGEMVKEEVKVNVELEDKLGVLELVWSTDQEKAFISYFIKVDDNMQFRFMDISNTLQMKEDIEKVLEPLEMWDEEKFGLYVVQYCSY